MTREEYRLACRRVSVLSDLLAQEIRSACRPGPRTEQLELQAEAIAVRFRALAVQAITTAAERRMFARRLQALCRKD